MINKYKAKRLVPFGVLLCLGYGYYAAFYRLGYKEIYQYHSHGIAIVYWILLAFSQLVVYIYWVLIFVYGPGKAPEIRTFDIHNGPLPEYFFCDKYGYPIFCSHCKSLTLPRTKHSYYYGYCVRKFDHFCIWIGTEIGETNYQFFMKFTLWFMISFLIALIFLVRFTKSNYDKGLDNNFIVIYFLGGLWILMLLTLCITNFYYISKNLTMYDDILMKRFKREQSQKKRTHRKNRARKFPKNKNLEHSHDNSNQRDFESDHETKSRENVQESGKRYLNINHNNCRVVIKFSVNQYPFSFKFYRGWINLWLYGNGPKVELVKPSITSFIISTFIYVIPFLEFIKRSSNIPVDEESQLETHSYSSKDLEYDEWLQDKQRNIDLYEKYFDSFGEEFTQYISTQINAKKYTVPEYLKGSDH